MTYRHRVLWALVILACVTLLMAPALWNGFPLLQFDTGGYLAPWYDGQLRISRSVPYGLLLVAGQRPNFWPVLIVQSALTIWVVALTLRAHRLGGRPFTMLAIIAALCLLTTLPWLTAILLTDIFAGTGVLALYLLLLRDESLNRNERTGLVLLVACSAASHSATLAVLVLLVVAAGVVSFVGLRHISRARFMLGALALTLAVIFVYAADFLVTGKLVWTPGGPALSFGRMLQDGIVKTYLDDHCPDQSLRLCAYKNVLPKDADDFFWGESVFDKLGRFEGMNEEMRRIALASLADYPLLQIKSALSETGTQLLRLKTGAGVVKWIWNTYESIKAHAPSAVPAMKAARQQRTGISFNEINRVQVPLALVAMAALPFIALLTLRRSNLADLGELAAAGTLAILANAIVFGTLATAHNRYGARMAWIAMIVVLILLARILDRRTQSEIPGLPA
jgi:hypothetical protein